MSNYPDNFNEAGFNRLHGDGPDYRTNSEDEIREFSKRKASEILEKLLADIRAELLEVKLPKRKDMEELLDEYIFDGVLGQTMIWSDEERTSAGW